MNEKQFTTDYSDFLKDNKTWIKRGNERLTYEEIVDLLNDLSEQNKQLKYINNQIDEELIDEEMTNMECLMLLIPFGILFVLLTAIIIAFLVQLGWVVI